MIGFCDGFPNFNFSIYIDKIGQVVPGELRQAILTVVFDLDQSIPCCIFTGNRIFNRIRFKFVFDHDFFAMGIIFDDWITFGIEKGNAFGNKNGHGTGG
jgi:hypothetical protein